tara:strand:- start:8839 stop:10209 length:1371 start_codon:yes stop_codon:yes gene_type:complete
MIESYCLVSGAMRRLMLAMVISSLVIVSASPIITAEQEWPGEPIDNHVHMTWAAMTIEVNDWADDNPDIVDLVDIGDSELGKTLWVVRLSDWSMETKADGSPKEVIYIDGGHHGNEYLGTALAWLSAKWYINGWNNGNEEAIRVLQNSEVHVLIMLNPDGNDFDTRWNINQVDLNRNYNHYWNTCSPTQPGTSAFSESETLANSIYMNTEVPDADLYVTMHTGVWIMLYPWGKWPEQPSDWELFHQIRDDVHANISDIPIRNANQGLYPNCGTSRDYGYGVMGFPTFTFETDDEQFVPGSFESLNERLEEEMDVMRYLIENIWYWRARLSITSFDFDGNNIKIDVSNLGRATTANATVRYIDQGNVLWTSDVFGVNATNSSKIILSASNLTISESGNFELYYQKRVIDSSMWVSESINSTLIMIKNSENGFLPSPSIILSIVCILFAAANPRENKK